jgi:simple sugar transport system permease protein
MSFLKSPAGGGEGVRTRLKSNEPASDTNLLLVITICIFLAMYLIAVVSLGAGFLKPQTFLNLFNENAALIVMSCGLSIVMVGAGIDISVGGVTALVCMSCVVYLDDHGGNVAGSIGVALAIGLAFGVAQGFLISYLQIQPFIVTLAGMFFARGMTTIVEVNPRSVENEAFNVIKNTRIILPGLGTLNKNGTYVDAYIEPGVVVALAVVAVLFICLKWTRFGRNLYAIGGNSQSALMLGINLKRTKFISYILSGLLAGIGGYIYFMHTGYGAVTQASGAEMKAIASSIIGGTLLTGGVGNIVGTLFGVLSLGTINNIVTSIGLDGPWWTGITIGGMLCFFIVLQSIILGYRNRKRISKKNNSSNSKEESDGKRST